MSIKLFKTCRVCGTSKPRGWTEASTYKCEGCEADSRAAWREMLLPQYATQSQAQKAAQSKPDPRSVALARQMAHDPRPAARGTQQDPSMDPTLAILTYAALTENDPAPARADWDDSSHRQYEASSVSSACDNSSSYHHTSHDSSSSYDSGSDSSSYSSGGCD